MRWDELALYEVWENPIFFIEFCFDREDLHRFPPEKSYSPWWFQYWFLLPPVGIYCCGRGIGKTEMGVVLYSIWYATRYGGRTLLVVPHTELQARRLLYKLARLLEHHPLIRQWMQSRGETQLVSNFIVLDNGAMIHITWPGASRTHDAPKILGLRADGLIYDEYQEFDEDEVGRIDGVQIVEPTDPNDVLSGAIRKAFGVPSAASSPLKAAWKSKEAMVISQKFSPLYTRAKDRENMRRYHCQDGLTPGYCWNVLGTYVRSEDKEGRVFAEDCLRGIFVEEFEYGMVVPNNRMAFQPVMGYEEITGGVDLAASGITSCVFLGRKGEVWEVVRHYHFRGFSDPVALEEALAALIQTLSPSWVGFDIGYRDTLVSNLRRVWGVRTKLLGFHFASHVLIHVEDGAWETDIKSPRGKRWKALGVATQTPLDIASTNALVDLFYGGRVYLPLPDQAPALWRQLREYRFSSEGKRYLPEHPHDISALKAWVVALKADQRPEEDDVYTIVREMTLATIP